MRDRDIVTEHRASHQIGASFDPIRNDGVLGPAQGITPLDEQDVGTGTLDGGSHRIEQVGQVDDLRLLRAVAQHRRALGQGGGHHQVLGTGHGFAGKGEVGRVELVRPGLDVAVLEPDLGTHPDQALDVEVDRALADGAAAGQRHPRAAVAGQQRPQHQDRGPHRLDQVVGRLERADFLDADRVGSLGRFADRRAELLEHPQHRAHVAHPREVAQRHRLVGQQAGRQRRQRGVLGPGDADAALQSLAAVDLQFIHGSPTPDDTHRGGGWTTGADPLVGSDPLEWSRPA